MARVSAGAEGVVRAPVAVVSLPLWGEGLGEGLRQLSHPDALAQVSEAGVVS